MAIFVGYYILMVAKSGSHSWARPGFRDLGADFPWGCTKSEADLSSFESCLAEAEQGGATAQAALAQMYAKGEGVDKDFIAAYMWYTVSEKALQAVGEQTSSAKKQLEQLLSQEEVIEARKRALQHLKKPRPSGIGVGAAGGTNR